MDIEFDQEYCNTLVPFNQDILDGLVYKQMRDPKAWVDARIRQAEKTFGHVVEFVGSRVCTPQEAFRVVTDLYSKIDRGRMIDMAQNDVFLVRYEFKALGVDLLPCYMFLPNFKKGNRIRIAGKVLHAMVVLTDPGFSVTDDYVFIRMTRAPVTFKRLIYTTVKDDVTNSRYMAYSKLHWKGGENDRGRESDSIKVGDKVTTLAHYLFCKYGLLETFTKFAGVTPIIMEESELTDEIRQTHTVYTSRRVAPRAVRLTMQYSLMASTVCLLIPKGRESTLLDDLVTGFFYTLDHFPDVTDYHELYGNWLWKVFLGYTLWGDQLGHGKLVENVEAHLKSLDGQLDAQTQMNLKCEEGLEVDNIYQLFVYICSNMNTIISKNEGGSANLYGKRLISTPYILKDIGEKIFGCMYELTSPRKKPYTVGDYNQILRKYFTISTIMSLRNTSLKPFMVYISSPGDNMYYKGTSRLIMQDQTGASGPGSSDMLNVDDPSNHIDVSWVEVGNYGVLPHATPLARQTLNPTVQYDTTYTITPKEHLNELREHIRNALSR